MGALNFGGRPRKVKSAQRPPKDKRNPDVVSFRGRFSGKWAQNIPASVGSTTGSSRALKYIDKQEKWVRIPFHIGFTTSREPENHKILLWV